MIHTFFKILLFYYPSVRVSQHLVLAGRNNLGIILLYRNDQSFNVVSYSALFCTQVDCLMFAIRKQGRILLGMGRRGRRGGGGR